ncbi:MAG: TetR/AcrR family transcriptional regulator [Litorimonas sp.]
MSPEKQTSKPRRRLAPDDRRKQLLHVGLKVFANLGIEGAGHANIAKAANVSTATVFNYFPTRPILTQELVWEIKAILNVEFNKMTQEWDFNSASPKSRIYHMAATYNHIIDTKPEVFKAFLMWSVSFNQELRSEFIEFQDSILKRLETLMGPTIRHKGHARVLFGAANTLAMMRFDNYPVEDLTGYVVALTKGFEE